MTGDTAPAEPASIEPLAVLDAFVSLLIGSARADGAVSPHEANRIEHVVAGMKLFRGIGLETRHTIFSAAAERIKEQGIDRVIRQAATIVPGGLTATAFAVAVDLMLSDGSLTASEQRFTEELRGLLGIDREMAARIIDVLTIKNAG